MTNRVIQGLLLAVFFLLSTSITFGCLNPIGQPTVSSPIAVHTLSLDEFRTALSDHPGRAYWLGVFAELKLEDPRSVGYDPVGNKNNTAVAMLHLGIIERAIEILEGLERSNPGDYGYFIAANLGTAYELNGENVKALNWIKEGMKRDPSGHNGSEWLHVKILEAKLAIEKDSNWLAHNSVIGLHRISDQDLRSGKTGVTDNLGREIDLYQVEEALIYQLHERLEFIKPPEGVVANLLFDLSRTLARTRSPEHSAIIREFAHTYGPDLMPWSAPDPVLPAVELPPPAFVAPYWIAGGSVLVVALATGLFALRRWRSNQ